MDGQPAIRVLLIESDEETIRTVNRLLVRETEDRFVLTAVHDVARAVSELSGAGTFDLILMSFTLATDESSGGVASLRKVESRTPVIFLGTRKDITMAVNAMRVGGRDLLLIEDLDSHIFPQTLLGHYEKHRLSSGVDLLDIRRERLEAMQELVVDVTREISDPLQKMRETIAALEAGNSDEKAAKYLTLIRENLERLADKMEKLKNLQDDKTVTYIKNINMIDLS